MKQASDGHHHICTTAWPLADRLTPRPVPALAPAPPTAAGAGSTNCALGMCEEDLEKPGMYLPSRSAFLVIHIWNLTICFGVAAACTRPHTASYEACFFSTATLRDLSSSRHSLSWCSKPVIFSLHVIAIRMRAQREST